MPTKRLISFNVNGIRASVKKGFYDTFKQLDADFLCLQETKAQDDQTLEAMAARLTGEMDQLRKLPGIKVHSEEIWHNPAVKFDERCVAAVSGAAESLGYSNQRIVSGAGHDACQVCRIVPTSMIFVPCEGGLSHNEEEHAEPADLEAGCNVLLHAMLELAGKP